MVQQSRFSAQTVCSQLSLLQPTLAWAEQQSPTAPLQLPQRSRAEVAQLPSQATTQQKASTSQTTPQQAESLHFGSLFWLPLQQVWVPGQRLPPQTVQALFASSAQI
jgi:hypothetical protein